MTRKLKFVGMGLERWPVVRSVSQGYGAIDLLPVD